MIVPASFSLAVAIEAWAGPKLGRRLLTYRPGDDGRPVIDNDPVPPKLGGQPGTIIHRGGDEEPQPAE